MNSDKFKVYRCKQCGHWPEEHTDTIGCAGCDAAGYDKTQIEHTYNPDPLGEYDIQLLPGVTVLVDGVYIYDEHGEIVMWHIDEFPQDKTAAIAMAEALRLYYEWGPAVLRKRLDKEIYPTQDLLWKAGERSIADDTPPEEALNERESVELAVRGFLQDHPEVTEVSWVHQPYIEDEDWLVLKVRRNDGYLFVYTDGTYELFDKDDRIVLEDDYFNADLEDELVDAGEDYADFANLLYVCMTILRRAYGTRATVSVTADGAITVTKSW